MKIKSKSVTVKSTDGKTYRVHLKDENTRNVAAIKSGTKAYWETQSHVQSQKDYLYFITDYFVGKDGKTHPAIKIGDGNAYIGDLPLIVSYGDGATNIEEVVDHMEDKQIHITKEEREKWNEKVSCDVDEANGMLILTKG